MSENYIKLQGVKQNNLKNIDVEIPIGSFTVICGPSGSGKSSLAFETLYAEGQRRYIESLSNYTKQFLNKAPKPDLEHVENIPPAIAIEQKNSIKSSRSTVGTASEIIDYIRLLYEKIGKAYCPHHGIVLEKEDPTKAAKKVLKHFADQRGYILCPISASKRVLKSKKLYELLKKEGFLRIYKPTKTKEDLTRAVSTKQIYSNHDPGEVLTLDDPKLRKSVPKETFYLVIDRVQFKSSDGARLRDSIAQAFINSRKFNFEMHDGKCRVVTTEGSQLLLEEADSCSVCGFNIPEISTRLFSFNNPVGACLNCNGFGNILTIDEEKIVPNPKLTIAQGALKVYTTPSAKSDRKKLLDYCKKYKISTHTPWETLPNSSKKLVWSGGKGFRGIEGLFKHLETKKYKMHVRVFLSRHKSPTICSECNGSRLKPEAQIVKIKDRNITDVTLSTISELLPYYERLKLTKKENEMASEILLQIKSRLSFLNKVGLGYLSLNRESKTLSGGEYQRLNLANQLGMALSQTLYVLDEPTVGLHPRDNDRLIQVLKNLNELDNTLVVVEHDHDIIVNSSHIIEMGPQSGLRGGEVIFSGTKKDFYNFDKSLTLPYLSDGPLIYQKKTSLQRRSTNIKHYKFFIELKGCKGNNLKNINIKLPLHRLVTVTGVSGSGKSSLISGTLYPAISKELQIDFPTCHKFKSISGVNHLSNVLLIDQSPAGKTERSTPVTYLKIFDHIRALMSTTVESKAHALTPGNFSLNVDGGRCPICKGLGYELIDMIFMDDIKIPCDQCDGKKYKKEILGIKYNNKNIYEILRLTVDEAMPFFVNHPKIRKALGVLSEVGLGYIQLGQSTKTLSGGESQRLKIAKEFNFSKQKNTLFILDEPTTGLHFQEVTILLKLLNKLIDAGGSVIVVEHNLEVIRNSDYIIDIGPEAGEDGGSVVAQGCPEDIVKSKKSHTGRYLKDYLK